MKISFLAPIAALLFLPSCQSVSIVDEPQLGKPAMSFENQGARSMSIGLTSQVEKGRSVDGASSGGACASCH